MHDQTVNNLMLLALGAAIGVNVLFWSVVGLLRYLSESCLEAADDQEAGGSGRRGGGHSCPQ